jgi:hypothetical protein
LKEESYDKEQQKNDEDILKKVAGITRRLSPIILPMISYLGELEIET